MKRPPNIIDHQSSLSALFSVSEREITPDLAIYARNWGAAKFDNAQAVHRPLMMQCLIIKSSMNEEFQIIITADLGWWKNNQDEWNLRQAILSHFNLSEDQLLICLSHTHSGPSISSKDVDQPGGSLVPAYLILLKEWAIELINESLAKLEVGSLTWGIGKCDLALKRDFLVNNEFLVGYDPDSEADQTLLVGVVRNSSQVPIAILANYACHPTTFGPENQLLSPDFVGAMREIVFKQKKAPCIFLQGASGDLAPMEQYVNDPEIVDAHGRKLGYAILSVIEGIRPSDADLTFTGSLVSGAPLALWKRRKANVSSGISSKKFEIEVAFKNLPSIELIRSEYEACQDRVLKDRLWRKLTTRTAIENAKKPIIPLWVWQFGETILIAQPNEAYSLYQESVRNHFPDKTIVFINIANGYLGYLPPANLYSEDIYAVWQTPYAKGTLEQLIKRTKEIISNFT